MADGPVATAYDQRNGYVYVAQSGDFWDPPGKEHNVTVINGTGTIAKVDIGTGSIAAVYDDRNGYVYVLGGPLIVFNGTKIVARINYTVPVPCSEVYDPFNGYVYVAGFAPAPTPLWKAGIVDVINGTSLVATISGFSAVYSGGAYDSGTGDVYFGSETSNVSVIQGTRLVGSIPVGNVPAYLAYDASNGFVYSANSYSRNVSVINGTSIIATIPLSDSPVFPIYNPSNRYVYVTAQNRTGVQNGSVSVINGTTVIASLGVGGLPESAVYDVENGYIYVSNRASVGLPRVPNGTSNVTIIDGTKIIGAINVGKQPLFAAYDDRNRYVYVPCSASNNVSVINQAYPVVFREIGIASSWSVSLNGSTNSSFGPNVTFWEADGNYSFSISGPAGYLASPPTGSLTIHGTGKVVLITFSQTYPVTFTESGLPGGDSWELVVDGASPVTTSSTTLSVREPNGTHHFSGVSVDRTNMASGGSFTVRAAGTNVTVTFSWMSFGVTFTSLGLPVGTRWSVSLGGSVVAATGTSLTFAESNGTYSYVLGRVTGWRTGNPTGQVVVVGSAVSRSFSWSQVTYAIVATETGLPNGTGWSVHLSGGVSNQSNSPTLSLSQPNGTYAYSVSTANTSYRNPGGSVVVNGVGTSFTVAFSRVTYTLNFAETGLSPGMVWTVKLGATSRSGVGIIAFTEIPNGTYTFVIGSVSGSTPNPSYGTLTVHGLPPAQAVRFNTTSATPPGSPGFLGLPPMEGYLLVGGIAVLTVGAGLWLVARRSKHKLSGNRMSA